MNTSEPQYDETNNMAGASSEDSDQPGLPSVWSESSLSAWRKIGYLATHWVHSKDTDQAGRITRLIWLFVVRMCYFVGFVMLRLIFISRRTQKCINKKAMIRNRNNRFPHPVPDTKQLRRHKIKQHLQAKSQEDSSFPADYLATGYPK